MNSDVLCSLNMERRSNGLDIKRAIIAQRCMNFNTILAENIDPLSLRISILTQTGSPSRTKWHILNSKKQIGTQNGKYCVEFMDKASEDHDTAYGNKATGKMQLQLQCMDHDMKMKLRKHRDRNWMH